MRIMLIVLLMLHSIFIQAMAPRIAGWTAGGTCYLATLDGGQLHFARLIGNTPQDIARLPGDGLVTLVEGRWRGQAILLAARGRSLLRFDLQTRTWKLVGTARAPIREVLPLPNDESGALLLTGTSGNPAPTDGAVWYARWRHHFTLTRVSAIKPIFRPWQLWWARTRGEQRFAAATYKSTYFVPIVHNCMFVFSWQRHIAKPRWLGSRLSRPYVDATHADLRADGNWRMIAVEQTHDGGHALSVYHPIGFGYEGEWRMDNHLPGLQRVAAYGDIVICYGEDAATKSRWARQLLPDGEQYQLLPMAEVPPSPETLARLDSTHLAGYWEGHWHILGSQASRLSQ